VRDAGLERRRVEHFFRGVTMSREMSCYVLHGIRDIRLEKRAIPSVKPDEVLVKMKTVGICGSDIHYYVHGYVGSSLMKHPFVIGHEGAGEVTESGNEVTDLRVGMHVAIDPSQPCRACSFCKAGHYNLCPNMRYLGSAANTPHTEGLFSEYFAMPARNCYPFPDSLSYSGAAMIEPLSVAMHVVRRAGDIDGLSALIIGGGTIGQLILSIVREFGAVKIAMSEILKERRDLGLSQGAHLALDPMDPLAKEKAMDFSGGGFNVVIEASGASSALRQALDLTRRRGIILVVGLSMDEVSLPIHVITTKELQILGSFRFTNDFSDAIQLAASGRVNLKPLITNTLPFSRLKEAIQLAASRSGVMKVQVEL
jgi:L-idonate 5-dehydrogenase